jgi:hypothetical protein
VEEMKHLLGAEGNPSFPTFQRAAAAKALQGCIGSQRFLADLKDFRKMTAWRFQGG